MNQRSWILLTLIAAALAGCNTIRFDVSHAPSAKEPVVDRKAFWFFGVTSKDVDVRAMCPYGVAAIDEETTFTDGLFSNLTLGIYTPRTSYYWCRLPAPVAPQPPAGGTP